ncbi:MAG: uncharacterized membrane protein YjfL (UPF0719 family) [Planctomycetota bacterium]
MFEGLGMGLAYAVVGLVVLIAAKVALDLVTSYSIDEELTSRDNRALGLGVAGYYLGVIAVFLGAVLGPDVEPTREALINSILVVLGYSAMGVTLLLAGRRIIDYFVLPTFSVQKEIIEDQNVGTGAVQAGCYIATGLVAAGSIYGESGGIVTALGFFLVGQLTLALFGRLYQLITSFDLHQEIEQDNEAAGYGFAGSLIALGIILMKATSLPFHDWGTNLLEYAVVAVSGFVALILARIVTDHALLPASSLSHEIAADRNVGAAWIEGATAIGMAAIIFLVI